MTPVRPRHRCRYPYLVAALACALAVAGVGTAAAQQPAAVRPAQARLYADWDGERIMRESQHRHQQFPYVYEEQTMVLIDAAGQRSVRRCRRFTRYEDGGEVKFLLVFDEPAEIRGVALLARRSTDGDTTHGVYLPAYGKELKRAEGEGLGGHFLGTDFAVEDLAPAPIEDYRYVRQRDRYTDGTEYFVVDAYPIARQHQGSDGYGLRRHVIRKDNFMVVQTDVYDTTLRFFKRITHHDLKRVDGNSWRANMVIAHDRRESHRTLLKINRRVYSSDYVPAEVFEPDYLLANRHVVAPAVGVEPGRSQAEQQLLERGDGS